MKALAFKDIEALSHGFGTRCLRFKSHVTVRACKTRFRLLAKLYREGFDPSEFQQVVSINFDFPHYQIYPGAIQQLSGRFTQAE
jgi:hypothetical protein